MYRRIIALSRNDECTSWGIPSHYAGMTGQPSMILILPCQGTLAGVGRLGEALLTVRAQRDSWMLRVSEAESARSDFNGDVLQSSRSRALESPIDNKLLL